MEDLQDKLKRSDAKLQAIKSQAEEKLDRANEDIDKITRSSKQDLVRLEAAVKKADLRISGLEDSLQRKVRTRCVVCTKWFFYIAVSFLEKSSWT